MMQSRGGEERVITDRGEREKTTEGRERKRRRGQRENDGGEREKTTEGRERK